MIKTFEIHKFRKYEHIKFDNLGRINIFLGNNNVGKTTVLESLYGFACGPITPSLIRRSILRTNKMPDNIYEFIEKILTAFHDQDRLPLKFSLKAIWDGGLEMESEYIFHPGDIFADLKPRLLGTFGSSYTNDRKQSAHSDLADIIGHWESKFKEDGEIVFESNEDVQFPLITYRNPVSSSAIQGRFVDILEHRDQKENAKIFSYLYRENLLKEFVEELSKTYEMIDDIVAVPYPNGSGVQISFRTKEGKLLPLYSFGDGVQRWFNILGGMIIYQKAIHCIEEIDATMHPNAQKEMAKNLVHYAEKYDTQLFMTSHSLEFVDNLLEAVYGEGLEPLQDCIRIITLRNDKTTNKTKVRVLTGKDAYESREKYRLELR